MLDSASFPISSARSAAWVVQGCGTDKEDVIAGFSQSSRGYRKLDCQSGLGAYPTLTCHQGATTQATKFVKEKIKMIRYMQFLSQHNQSNGIPAYANVLGMQRSATCMHNQ
ncbi:hypothetical protein FOIG_16612 [Fusarium odoratissimum NRRL 54006]|uniref:Uncharacterized protein n=1 Tax=Fusarium odoratissimum (strain NRRL 54006) TaxID=1089451 RepID=X0JZ43_FUSO5|nr:uncharacterized protein FOIG_16612 [Fusarium odoratissimum NRRL 54006]EXL90124.1 hypothetical protein FOIG_16612 [Fusarium odoratissimum NRRL 54006]